MSRDEIEVRWSIRRWGAAVVALLVVLVLTGCRVDAAVRISVDDDGSGSVDVAVELDGDAARLLGDPAEVLAVDDLRAAGWSVADPEAVGDGLRIAASRSFASPDQLPAILDEVGGVDGVFRDVRLDIEDGFGETAYRFEARVVLSGSPEQFSDDDLAAQLDGLPLGRTPEELFLSGAPDPEAITLTVAVRLPGGLPETDGRFVGGAAEWDFPVTGLQPTDAVVQSSSVVTGQTTVLIALGVLLLAAAVVVLVVAIRRR